MTDYVTASDGTSIAYEAMGEGPPVVLIHGFGANRKITWANTGWVQTLTRAGHRVIAVDCRGHGESGKRHAPEDYDEGLMAQDVVAVLDGLKIASADLMGYSMGGQIVIRVMHDAPERVRRAVIGGVGENYFSVSKRSTETIAQGLLESDVTKITDPTAREFRVFCERAGDDLMAMAACMKRERCRFSQAELYGLPHKVLLICGELDDLAGSPERLAKCFRDAATLMIPTRNHHSAVGDKRYKEAATAFFAN